MSDASTVAQGAATWYREATDADIEFFLRHGYVVVDQVVPSADLDRLEQWCDELLEKKETLAFDWAWDASEDKEARSFRIVQSSPSLVSTDIKEARFRSWAAEFGSALLGKQVEFWYDQFLAKPPGKSLPTYWHQDEGYWGRNLDEKGITCWIPLQDVDEANGCMHFVDGGHLEGVLEHRLVDGVQSDLLMCTPDDSRAVACPISRGSVTFHHSKTPHMTTANMSAKWRKAVTQHMQTPDAGGEGGHYPWKIYVNQYTGQRIVPPVR